jgi:2-polyprenyl-3-methyl-5-hydroxy-6-metoxy-1,4-benzoquinol methylase
MSSAATENEPALSHTGSHSGGLTGSDAIDYSLQYRRWHDASDAHYQQQAAFYLGLLAPVIGSLPRTIRVLDIGCGTGLLVNALQSAGFTAVRGIDTSAQQIETARSRGLPCQHVGPQWLEQTANAQPGSLDLICLMDVLEHIEVAQQMAFMRHIARLLAPGGQLVLSVPNANASFAARQLYIDWTHVCAFTEHSLDFVLQNAGLGPGHYLSYEYGLPPRFPYVHHAAFWVRLLRRVFRGLRRLQAVAELGHQGLKIPLGLNLLAVARRAT